MKFKAANTVQGSKWSPIRAQTRQRPACLSSAMLLSHITSAHSLDKQLNLSNWPKNGAISSSTSINGTVWTRTFVPE